MTLTLSTGLDSSSVQAEETDTPTIDTTRKNIRTDNVQRILASIILPVDLPSTIKLSVFITADHYLGVTTD
ncbi:hypothetical protein [Desulfolithobacter sp.]